MFGCKTLGLKNPACVKEMTNMRYAHEDLFGYSFVSSFFIKEINLISLCVKKLCKYICTFIFLTNVRLWNRSLQWTFLSAQCLEHMGTIRLCRFRQKVLAGVAFKCSLHPPWDWWTSLKCPITSLCPPPLQSNSALSNVPISLFAKNNPHLERSCAIKSNFETRI